jgi:hypothetical protein
MSKLTWEWIDDEWPHGGKPDGFTYRAKVRGGWLVSVWAGAPSEHGLGGGMTFVPDRDHDWVVDTRKK